MLNAEALEESLIQYWNISYQYLRFDETLSASELWMTTCCWECAIWNACSRSSVLYLCATRFLNISFPFSPDKTLFLSERNGMHCLSASWHWKSIQNRNIRIRISNRNKSSSRCLHCCYLCLLKMLQAFRWFDILRHWWKGTKKRNRASVNQKEKEQTENTCKLENGLSEHFGESEK